VDAGTDDVAAGVAVAEDDALFGELKKKKKKKKVCVLACV
jgi:hypothetical protein